MNCHKRIKGLLYARGGGGGGGGGDGGGVQLKVAKTDVAVQLKIWCLLPAKRF